MEQISPTGDLAFKKVFASEENKEILGGFIYDFFGVVAENIQIISPYSIDIFKKWRAGEEDINELRHTLRDVAASFKTADFISEVQIRKTLHFDERTLYYPFKRFCENYNVSGRMIIGKDGKPNRYSSLRPVYALNVLGYNHFEDDDALRIFELYDPERGKRPNKELLKIGYFELTKPNIETANQKHWHDFFTAKEIKPDAPNYIKNASKIIDFTNLREEERKVVEALEKAEATLQDELAYSFYEGRAEGRTEGKAEGEHSKAIATAKKLLEKGMSPDEVAEINDLPLAEVEALVVVK